MWHNIIAIGTLATEWRQENGIVYSLARKLTRHGLSTNLLTVIQN